MEVRQHELDGKNVFVLDGLFSVPTCKRLAALVERLAYQKTEAATPDTRQYLHWVAHLRLDDERLPGFYELPEQAARFFFPGSGKMFRAYVNHASSDDVLLVHTDCPPGVRVVTGLVFACSSWDRNWGGELMFFRDQEADLAISPKPGRLVLFDGRLPHAGRPPSRHCPVGRYTLALKWSFSEATASPDPDFDAKHPREEPEHVGA